MMRYDKVQGLPVFSIREGRRAGIVRRAVLDKSEKRVTGFRVEHDGDRWYELPVEAVEAYGTDAVMIASEDLLRGVPAGEEVSAGQSPGPVIGTRVVTRAGVYAGDIASFFFDERTGRITHFEISGGMFRDMMHGRGLVPQEGIITLGDDICVADNTVREISSVMKSEPGMRDRTLAVKNRMEGGIKKFRSRTKNWTESVGKAFSLHGSQRRHDDDRDDTRRDDGDGKS
jgi:uncharacterized protein YrrD